MLKRIKTFYVSIGDGRYANMKLLIPEGFGGRKSIGRRPEVKWDMQGSHGILPEKQDCYKMIKYFERFYPESVILLREVI